MGLESIPVTMIIAPSGRAYDYYHLALTAVTRASYRGKTRSTRARSRNYAPCYASLNSASPCGVRKARPRERRWRRKSGMSAERGALWHLYVAVYVVINENCVALSWLIVTELADVGSRLLASKQGAELLRNSEKTVKREIYHLSMIIPCRGLYYTTVVILYITVCE